MTSPAAAPQPRGSFQIAIEEALSETRSIRTTAGHALKTGVIPDEIIDYVRGRPSADIEHMLARSPWAMGRVVVLVKAKRDPASLGARILASHGQVQPPHWGIQGSGDPDADLAYLLDQVG